jgi:hypothetical protein
MFAAVWRQLDSGDVSLALLLESRLAQLPPGEARRVTSSIFSDLLGTLLQGALLERGATVLPSFGDASLTLELEQERYNATEALELLARDRETGRQRFEAWAKRFDVA